MLERTPCIADPVIEKCSQTSRLSPPQQPHHSLNFNVNVFRMTYAKWATGEMG